MRPMIFSVFAAALLAVVGTTTGGAAQPPKDAPKTAAKDTAAAEMTRTKLLKAKVAANFDNVPLGEILKELAHLIVDQTDEPLMWAYGEKFPFDQKLTIVVKEKTLDEALDEVLKKAGGGLGYVVVSKDGDKYDGWVRLTTTGERGTEGGPPAPPTEDDKVAAERLALAKKLVDAGKFTSAKPVLELIVRKYPATKAAAEAKELLAKVEKDK